MHDDDLIEAIRARREDSEFMERLRARVEQDAPLLLRMSEHSSCSEARLVESRSGGALLVYRCECDALLVRSRAEAEAQAAPDGKGRSQP